METQLSTLHLLNMSYSVMILLSCSAAFWAFWRGSFSSRITVIIIILHVNATFPEHLISSPENTEVEIELKSCYLAAQPASKFPIHVRVFFKIAPRVCGSTAVPQAGGKKREPKSGWEHSGCLSCEHILSLLTCKKKSSFPCRLHGNFKLQPKHTKSHWRESCTSPGCFIPLIYALNF